MTDPTFDGPIKAIGLAYWMLALGLIGALLLSLIAAPRAAPDPASPEDREQPGASQPVTSPVPKPTPAAAASDAPQTEIGPPLVVDYGEVPNTATSTVVGTATWYCGAGSPCTRGYPAGGLYAAAGSELRAWRGRLVRVRSGTRSVVVRIIDVCACPGVRIIDLYRAAFQQLSPDQSRVGRQRFARRGIIRVSVDIERALMTVPPTSTR